MNEKTEPYKIKESRNLWALDVTEYFKNLFGDALSKATLIYNSDEECALDDANTYIDMYEAAQNSGKNEYEYNGDDIILEFVNGKKVQLTNSEWASVKIPHIDV